MHRHAKGFGDGFGGNIVMRGANAAGGKNIIELGAALIHRGNNGCLNIGNHSHFAQLHARFIQLHGEVGKILILRAAREDFVADDN